MSKSTPEHDVATRDQLDEYARERLNETRRLYYARHPEQMLRNRLTSAANLLTKHGFIDPADRDDILARVGVLANDK